MWGFPLIKLYLFNFQYFWDNCVHLCGLSWDFGRRSSAAFSFQLRFLGLLGLQWMAKVAIELKQSPEYLSWVQEKGGCAVSLDGTWQRRGYASHHGIQWQSHRSCFSCPAWLTRFKNIICFLFPKIQYFHCQNTISRPYLVLKYTHYCIRSLGPFPLNTGFPTLSLFVFSPYLFSLLSLLWRSHFLFHFNFFIHSNPLNNPHTALQGAMLKENLSTLDSLIMAQLHVQQVFSSQDHVSHFLNKVSVNKN